MVARPRTHAPHEVDNDNRAGWTIPPAPSSSNGTRLMNLIDTIRAMEAAAGQRSPADPDGDVMRSLLRDGLDALDLPSLTVAVLRAVVVGLGRSPADKNKAGLIDAIRRVPLERVEVLFSAVS